MLDQPQDMLDHPQDILDLCLKTYVEQSQDILWEQGRRGEPICVREDLLGRGHCRGPLR